MANVLVGSGQPLATPDKNGTAVAIGDLVRTPEGDVVVIGAAVTTASLPIISQCEKVIIGTATLQSDAIVWDS